MSNDFKVSVQSSVSNVYEIKLYGDVDEPQEYFSELAAIEAATENDLVKIHICTDGGNVHTALLFRKALLKCPATTVAIIGPNCASAGTVIALSCDQFEIDEFSMFMVHTASWGCFGKHNEMKGQFSFKSQWISGVMDAVYSGFLSIEEIEQANEGKDFWIGADDLNDRLTYYTEYRKALYEAEKALDGVEPEE